MNKITLAALLAVSLSGCVTPPPTVSKVEEMPADKFVVARSLEEALNRSEKRINQNSALLMDVEQRRTLSPQVLEHNNQLDARSAADKQKIVGPQFPGNPERNQNTPANANMVAKSPGVTEGTQDIVGSDPAKIAKFNTNVQQLEWKNGSLNDFVRKIAAQVGYEAEIVPGNGRDVSFSMTANNMSILSVLGQTADINQRSAEITVSHIRQKIIVRYRAV